MNDASRELRYRLGTLCERYNAMIADKDTLDYRLGSHEPYEDTAHDLKAERAYERASHTISADLRALITEMIDVAQRIRAIEDF